MSTKIKKIFNFIIFKEIRNHNTQKYFKYIFGNTIKVYKHINNGLKNKSIYIFNLCIYKQIHEKYHKKIFLFKILIYNKSLIKIIFSAIKKKYNTQVDDIYILTTNSGEAYLILTYFINALIKKNNSKHPLVVATKKYHTDLINSITPWINYVYIKKTSFVFLDYLTSIDKRRIFTLFGHEFEKSEVDNINFHYYLNIQNYLQVKHLNKINLISHSKDYITNFDNRLKKENINISNLIFLSPCATSCKSLPVDFINKLIKILNNKGFSVFINDAITLQGLDSSLDWFSTKLTFNEAFLMAKKSKKIIIVRSGFSEFLIQTNVNMDIIYTDFNYDLKNSFLKSFTVSKIPKIHNSIIREFEFKQYVKLSDDISFID